MEKIAFISGETIYYWSSIVLTLATLTAICFFWSLYLGKAAMESPLSAWFRWPSRCPFCSGGWFTGTAAPAATTALKPP